MGGCEIYADAHTHEPLATFKTVADCDFAIAAVNLHDELLAALIAMEALAPITALDCAADEWVAAQHARAAIAKATRP